jgi:predicted nucleic acid-binding protein
VSGTIILDNEAVQALSAVSHPKHRRALALLDVDNQRARRRAGEATAVLVPVAVRIEAGWDRTHPRAALVNSLSRARDVTLGTPRANHATQLKVTLGVSVVDATIAETAQRAPRPIRILTSDTSDMTMIAAHLNREIRVITL